MSQQRYLNRDSPQEEGSHTNNQPSRVIEEEEDYQASRTFTSLQSRSGYAEPPLTSSSSAAFSSPSLDTSFEPFDGSFGNAHAWQQWEEQEQHSGTGNLQQAGAEYAFTGYAQANNPTAMTYFGAAEYPNNYSVPSLSSTYYQNDGASSSGYYLTAGTESTAPVTMSSSVEFTEAPRSHPQEGNHSERSSKKRASTQSSMTLNASSSKSSALKASSSKRSQRGRADELYTTERRYRGRMNDEFAALLATLPKELVEGSYSGKSLSKIEILDLAKKYIDATKQEQTDLENEGEALQAQVDFCKRMYASCGGKF
ncbi:hypothetical protein EG329_006998 [Mollisiaceae sp. DMI_Dod_QoI]|nr:hypothetical protein EG329_006998 [Helotiales sp. DMI_Dod_QoI]